MSSGDRGIKICELVQPIAETGERSSANLQIGSISKLAECAVEKQSAKIPSYWLTSDDGKGPSTLQSLLVSSFEIFAQFVYHPGGQCLSTSMSTKVQA